MFSKVLKLTLVVSFLGFAGCSKWLSSGEKKEDVIELSADKFSGINSLPDVFVGFTDGSVKEQEIREAGASLRDAFRYFARRYRGSMTDAYSTEDLRKFFSRYFLKQNIVTPELASQMMGLKKALIGGSAKYLTKSEIERLIEILIVLEDEAVKMSPQMPVIVGSAKNVTEARLDAAITQLKSSLAVLLKESEFSRSEYSFSDAIVLFRGTADFAQDPEQPYSMDSVKEWTESAEAIKNLLFGERASLHNVAEWTEAMGTLVGLYDLSLRYHYLLRNNHFSSGPELSSMTRFLDEALTLLETSHQLERTGRIPFTHIDRLIDIAIQNKFFPITVSAGTLKDLYQKVVVTILDPVRRGNTRGADAVERVHLLSLRREFNIFRVNQKTVDDLAPNKSVLSTSLLFRGLTDARLESSVASIPSDHLGKIAMRSAGVKFRNLLQKSRPVIFQPDGRIVVTPTPAVQSWSWQALTRANLMHSLTRAFLWGYGNGSDPLTAGCSKEGLAKWYEDFRPFGVEIRAFDPKAPNAGTRSHREANFFTYSGNGDEIVSQDEMYEFVSMLFSGGLGNATALRQHLDHVRCEGAKAGDLIDRRNAPVGCDCKSTEEDIFGLSKIKEPCFKQQLRASFSKNFDNLPGLVKYVKGLSNAEYDAFYGNLLSAARDSDPSVKVLTSSEIQTLSMILHYSESLFIVGDLNRDNKLDIQEIRTAAPRFMEFIKTMSPIKSEGFVREAFVVLVLKGQKPDALSLSAYQGRRILNFFGITSLSSADRGNIYKVFANLKTELSAAPVASQK